MADFTDRYTSANWDGSVPDLPAGPPQREKIIFQAPRCGEIDQTQPSIQDRLDRRIAQARRRKDPGMLVRFKVFNPARIAEEFGLHAARALMAQVHACLARLDDRVLLINGEELALVLPGTCRETALARAENMRREVATTPMTFARRVLPITVAYGIAALGGGGDSVAVLTEAAQNLDQLHRLENG